MGQGLGIDVGDGTDDAHRASEVRRGEGRLFGVNGRRLGLDYRLSFGFYRHAELLQTGAVIVSGLYSSGRKALAVISV